MSGLWILRDANERLVGSAPDIPNDMRAQFLALRQADEHYGQWKTVPELWEAVADQKELPHGYTLVRVDLDADARRIARLESALRTLGDILAVEAAEYVPAMRDALAHISKTLDGTLTREPLAAPPVVDVTEGMVDRAAVTLDSIPQLLQGSSAMSPIRDWARAILTAALAPAARGGVK